MLVNKALSLSHYLYEYTFLYNTFFSVAVIVIHIWLIIFARANWGTLQLNLQSQMLNLPMSIETCKTYRKITIVLIIYVFSIVMQLKNYFIFSTNISLFMRRCSC